MAVTIQKVRVFISSPGDVKEERARIGKVFEELNSTIAAEKGLVLEPIRWETHARTEIGDGPQAIINRQLGHDFDVFLGIMWQRFGTPTAEADSGTEEEFLHAYSAWEADRRRRILFYFCERPYTVRTAEEIQQLGKVIEFRSELEKKGLLGTYTSPEELTDRVRRDLTGIVTGWAEKDAEPMPAPTRFTVFIADVDGSLKLLQHSLAKKLEKEGIGVLRQNGEPKGEPWETEAIAQAHASIHLLGEAPHPGAERQLQAAMAAGQWPLLWVSRDQDLSAAGAHGQRLAALERREGVARDFDFIRERPLGTCKVILERVAKLRERWGQASAKKVLFNVHENDAEFAWELVAHLQDQMGLDADVYGLEDSPGMEAFEEKLASCSSMVFVFGKAESEWISNLMRHAMQKALVSGYTIGSWGVTLAPPVTKQIGEDQFKLPFRLSRPLQWIDMQHVSDEDAFAAESDRLREFFSGFAAASA